MNDIQQAKNGIVTEDAPTSSLDIAVVGMAGRFPGANTLEEFWENLKHGVESIRFYPENEVLDSGIFPEIARDPDFVAAAGGIDYENDFDAEFFEMLPREAEVMDPQQRIMLECAWETLESAGYNPETYRGRIGVYAGASINTYLMFNIAPNRPLLNSVGHFQVMTANDKDFLATRVAYKLGLKGPAMTIQTACSTSLVATNVACQSLLNFQSDMVLAGGVSITPKGRLYKESFIFSKDGHCRAFDAQAQGTVGGNGVGFVLLKRLDDAIADGDHIHAVIKGSAINNDGSTKVGYTAPSVGGQAEVILEAQGMAGIDPDTITYVEAHGTGTLLGDPIEIAALTQAFRTRTDRKQYCAMGSVKSNIGHLDTAAGISGLIKAVLTVENAQIPPSLHYNTPNPKLNIEETPFFINAELRDWTPPAGIPRRAAVSSFGFGGTNAHCILEEAPRREPTSASKPWQLLVFSARNDTALAANMLNFATHLREHPEQSLADAAYTLQIGRKAFAHRAWVAVANREDAVDVLTRLDTKRIQRAQAAAGADASVAFLFPGQGSQYIGMARNLFEIEPHFTAALKQCASLMKGHLPHDILEVIYPAAGQEAAAEALLTQTQYTQPALFAVEYALANMWLSFGIEPVAMIGHSIGEYVAAVLAGVMSLEDGVRLICMRGRIVQRQPGGAMLSVPLTEQALMPYLNSQLSLGALNAPGLSVVSGGMEAIDELAAALTAKGIETRRLYVSHAFHSHMLESAASEFETVLANIKLNAPTRRFISNVTGNWITDEEATSAHYWAQHLRQTVRFAEGVRALLQASPTVLLEVGPGQVLMTLVRQQRELLAKTELVGSTRHPQTQVDDLAYLQGTAGSLWSKRVPLKWSALYEGEVRRRIPLSTYAFQRKRHWIPPVFLSVGEFSADAPSSLVTAQTTGTQTEQTATVVRNDGPRDDVEHTIATIWQNMLGIPSLGIHDDFFKLGGHSLLATQLVAEVRRATNTEIAVQALFQGPTIAGMAENVKAMRAANPNYQHMAIPVISREGDLPLSYHQQAVWDFERKYPGSARFNGCLSIRIKGDLDIKGVHYAIDEIMRRHEVLRTNYLVRGGKSVAIVRPVRPIELPRHDLSELRGVERDAKLLQLANELARQPFDLRNDVYIRPILVRLAHDEHMMVIASHYVAVDGWTIGLVIQEFAVHYAEYKDPALPRMPDLPFQSVDYAAWQRARITDTTIEAHLPYWKRQLADVPSQQPVTPDKRRPFFPSIKGSTYHFTLGPDLTERVKAFSHEQGFTNFMTFVAALNVLYHASSGQKDIVIGTMTGDREIGTERMVGALVNMLALRNKINGTQSFLDVLAGTRQVAADAYAHNVPFSELAEKLGRNLIRNPLFRTVFILRNVPQLESKAGDVEVKLATLHLDRGVSDMDLSLYLQEKEGAFTGYFEYNTDLFHRGTIELLAKNFISILGDCMAEPQVPLSMLVPLAPERAKSALRRLFSPRRAKEREIA